MATRTLAQSALALLIALSVTGAALADVAPPPRRPAPVPVPTPEVAPTGRPVSKDALITRGLDALRAGDADAYVALLPTVDEFFDHCPEGAKKADRKQLTEQLTRLAAKTRERVAECAALFDWSQAKQVALEGGEAKHKDVCSGVRELEDIEALYEVGDKRYRVKLDDPFVLDGKLYGFGDDPRCRTVK